MTTFAATLLWALSLIVLVTTFLPLWRTSRWWVRAMSFPRPQIAILAGLVLVAGCFLPGPNRVLIPGLMLLACGYQIWRIFPYSRFHPTELGLAKMAPHAIRVLSSNVLMENKQHDLLIREIERFDPDILLLMETDETWAKALEPVLARFPTVVREPKPNYYGMIFATRLATEGARIVYLTGDDTPSIFAQLASSAGTPFRFVGLHPRPPVPGETTKDRDAQLYYAARFAAKSGCPLVAMGDFNDVAWSYTSHMFKRVGGYLDPRIGRGFFASFDAEKPYMRFPIDQFYVTEGIAVVSFERLNYVGSDHFPIGATILIDEEISRGLNRPPAPLSPAEQKEIAESVERSRIRFGHPEF